MPPALSGDRLFNGLALIDRTYLWTFSNVHIIFFMKNDCKATGLYLALFLELLLLRITSP